MAWTSMVDLATGDTVQETDMDALRLNIAYLLSPNKASFFFPSTTVSPYSASTSSTTWVALDTANLRHTITTNGGPVLMYLRGAAQSSGSGSAARAHIDIAVDGVRIESDSNVYGSINSTGSYIDQQMLYITPPLTAGSHYFDIMGKASSGYTCTFGQVVTAPIYWVVMEI